MKFDAVHKSLEQRHKDRAEPTIQKGTRWRPSAAFLIVAGFLVVLVVLVTLNCPVGYRPGTYHRLVTWNHLRQLALAFHDYHDDFGQLPRHAIYDAKGKPLLSWRVAVLPYLEEEQLYEEFRLNEPWDSPHNKPLMRKMPAVFHNQDLKNEESAAGLTHYQVLVTKLGLRPSTILILSPTHKRTLGEVAHLDGNSTTILIVEGPNPVPWTKPQDIEFDPKTPLPELKGVYTYGVNAAFADGSVRTVTETDADLRALITVDGNE